MKDRSAVNNEFQTYPGCPQAAECSASKYCFDRMMADVVKNGLQVELSPSPCSGVAKAQTNSPTKS